MSQSPSESSLLEKERLKRLVRKPLPPFKHNLYIGCCLNDVPFFLLGKDSLSEALKEDYKVSFCSRHQAGESANQLIKERIDDGVASSEKCLLVMTKNYFEDPNSHIEIQLIHKKAELFSKDMIIVWWLDKEMMESRGREFQQYRNIPLIDNLLEAERLFPIVNQIYEPLKASLMCLTKVNFGYGAAVGFFYGYLRLVLPDFRKRFRDAIERDTAALPNMKDRSVKKMLIILPRSCFCTISIGEKDGPISVVPEFYVKRNANRAGNMKRDYKSTVYKLVDFKDANKEYYFAGELATPLLTMFESHYFGLTGMTKEQLYMERDVFCYTLYQVLQNPDNCECNDQYKLLTWDDVKNADGKYEHELYDLLLSTLKTELEIEKRQEADPSFEFISRSSDSSNASTDSENATSKTVLQTTFEIQKQRVQDMSAMYNKIKSYDIRDNLKKGKRGKALIINIMHFTNPTEINDFVPRHLETRQGADKDRETVRKLFEDLGFEVAVYEDTDSKRLEQILVQYSGMDHSESDAFICCIMTHGNLGQIYAADCRPLRILDVVDYFSASMCKSLQGKPKLFFVQSCQRGYYDQNEIGIGNLQGDKRPTGGQTKLQPDSEPDHRPQPDGTENGADCNVASSGSVTTQAQEVSSEARLESDPHSSQSASFSNASSRQSSFEFLEPPLRSTLVPGEPDILMSYSALPGSLSYRDKDSGALYIQALNENLRKDEEITRVLMKVTADVAGKLKSYPNERNGQQPQQLPFHLTTGMTKLMYLTIPEPISASEQ